MSVAGAPSDAGTRPPIEIAWILAGPMDEVDAAAARVASEKVTRALEQGLPEFTWTLHLIHRREVPLGVPAEPVKLVDLGVLERDASHWDFVFVLTETPLQSHSRAFMLGAPAQAVDVAVLSTARLDPEATAGPSRSDARSAILAQRIGALVLHLFGHLNDLPHAEDRTDFMFSPRSEADLDVMKGFSSSHWERLRRRLAHVADPRIEEAASVPNRLAFYFKAVWLNRYEVFSGVKRIGSWWFPLRYSRLTTAAVSTQLVLMMTAEAWELGMGQPGARVAWLSAAALLLTTLYVLNRQHLLSRFGQRLTEQSVVAHASICIAVALGMASTYALLLGTTWVGSRWLFGRELVHNWTASIAVVEPHHYRSLAGFVASVGLVVGALGASFEEEAYFRRVTLLDEET